MKLIITEKPSVAKDIAKILNVNKKENGYYCSSEYLITYAFGHLISLENISYYNENISLDSLPIIPDNFKLKVTDDPGIKKQLRIIKDLAKKATSIINAADAGREGELIFRYIYNYLKLDLPMQRLWISSLTKESIKKGFQNLKNGKDYDNLYYAAKARSEADWLIGLNASIAISKANTKGLFLSLGRVQTPTLALIVKRTFNNKNFKPVDYFNINLKITKDSSFYNLSYKDKFDQKNEAQIILENITNKVNVTDVIYKEKKETTPLLFDLTSLQMEANKIFGYSAQDTLNLTQALYEKHKALTYPRTDSKYLSDDMHQIVHNTIKSITTNDISSAIKGFDNKKPFNNNKVTDHHAIIPTGNENLSNLKETELNIYNLVKNRFLAAFDEPCIKNITTITFDSSSVSPFTLKGTVIKTIGWRKFNNSKSEDVILPNFKIGEELPIISKEVVTKQTTPPPLLNDSSLLKLMETAGKEIEDEELADALKEKGIGTPATRASTIEVLIKREFVSRDKKYLMPTKLGIDLIKSVLKAKAEIVSPKLTGEWEYKLKLIEKGELSYENFKTNVTQFTRDLTLKTINAGKYMTYDPDINLPICPKCKKGKIKNSKKSFYCTNYNNINLKCTFTIWKNIAGKNVSENVIKQLINKGVTSEIKGFKSKAGKSFAAKLKLDTDFKVIFMFNENKKSKFKSKK